MYKGRKEERKTRRVCFLNKGGIEEEQKGRIGFLKKGGIKEDKIPRGQEQIF